MSPRKRTYSSMSGDFNSPYQQPRSREWASQEQPRHLPHPASSFGTPQSGPPAQAMFREPNYSPNGLPPNPQWRNAPEAASRSGGSFDVAAQAEHAYTEHVLEWNEQLIDAYVKAIPSSPVHNANNTPDTTRPSTPPIPSSLTPRLGSVLNLRLAPRL